MIITKTLKNIQIFHNNEDILKSWYENVGIQERWYFLGIPIYTYKVFK